MTDMAAITALKADLDSLADRIEPAEWDGTAWYGKDDQELITGLGHRAIAANETLIGAFYAAKTLE